MIISQDKQKQVVQSHDFDSVNCTIDAEDMRYVASLLRNNYSNPILAVVREISANALDANAEANASRKIEITLPSNLNPRFIVRDFGNGLSKEEVFGLYSKYGKSTKRSSNNYIGAFGIGKFAPLSYGDNFTCVSHHNGTKSVYNIFVNEDDDTKIVEIGKGVPTDEPSGLSLEVAVADSDVDTFRSVVKDFFRFFNKEELPKFIGVGDDEEFLEPYNVIMEGSDWFIIEQKQHGYNYHRHHHESHALMGRVSYPLKSDAINISAHLTEDQKEKGYANQLLSLIQQDNLYIRFDIGQLKLHHSREAIEYNKTTQKEIVSVLLRVREEVGEIAKEKLGNAEDIWDAKVKYAQVVNSLPYNLRGIFENSFEWNGTLVNNMVFQRDYKWQDDIIITEYFKEDDSDATNGYRVRSQKSNRINPSDDTALIIQDVKSHHGNALRVRTLFQKDENLKNAIIVRCATQDAEDHLYDVDGMQFNLIKKDRFNFASEIEKAKLQSRGKAVRGESRASVPLFELDWQKTNSYAYRNTDYWLNCTQNIDELESSDKVLIYVPIANYKVVDENATGQEESIALNSLVNDVNAILNLHKKSDDSFDKDNVLVLGVRRKDCSKLDKTLWSNWKDYKIDFCKQYVIDHEDELIASEKALAFNHNDVNMSDYHLLDRLLDSPAFRKHMRNNLDKTHIINLVVSDLEIMSEDNKDIQTLGRVVKYLRNNAKEWIEKNVKSKYDINEFNDNCKKVAEKYPLLANIAGQTYSYQSFDENDFGKNIVDYVIMSDLV